MPEQRRVQRDDLVVGDLLVLRPPSLYSRSPAFGFDSSEVTIRLITSQSSRRNVSSSASDDLFDFLCLSLNALTASIASASCLFALRESVHAGDR